MPRNPRTQRTTTPKTMSIVAAMYAPAASGEMRKLRAILRRDDLFDGAASVL